MLNMRTPHLFHPLQHKAHASHRRSCFAYTHTHFLLEHAHARERIHV